jgi:hypothetical protein
MSLPQNSEDAGKTKITIVLPPSLMRRIRRAMGISKRNLSAEIEYGMEQHVIAVEQQHGLTSNHLRDDWPD